MFSVFCLQRKSLNALRCGVAMIARKLVPFCYLNSYEEVFWRRSKVGQQVFI